MLDVSKTMLLSEPVRDVEKTAEKQQKTRVLAQALRRGFALSKSSRRGQQHEVIRQWFLVKPDILAKMSALVFKVAD